MVKRKITRSQRSNRLERTLHVSRSKFKKTTQGQSRNSRMKPGIKRYRGQGR